MTKSLLPVFATLAFSVVSTSTLSADFSGQTISLIVPHAAGTGVDGFARSYAPAIERALNATLVIENRVGASGAIGSAAVSKAAPDGRTLLFNANPPFITYPMTQDKPLYDAVKDFTPIAHVGAVPMVLVVSQNADIKDYKQFTEFVKANPDKANYASPGPGSAGYLAMAKLQEIGNFAIEHILYKSTPQSLADVAAGHLLSAFVSVPAAAPLVQSGHLRPIAIGSLERLTRYPNVPTLREATGVDDFSAAVWYGFFGPANMPNDVVNSLYEGFAKALEAPETQQAMKNLDIVPELQDPATFKETMLRDTKAAQASMQ